MLCSFNDGGIGLARKASIEGRFDHSTNIVSIKYLFNDLIPVSI